MVPLTGSSREPTEDQWGLTVRQQSSGRFEVALPASAAIDLFTPEGERSWVPGWDPVYATGAAGETAGTVFTTTVDGLATIWTIVQIDRGWSRYLQSCHAGLPRRNRSRVVCRRGR